jgi:hypothetical protein
MAKPCAAPRSSTSSDYLISAFAGRRGAVLAQLAIGERENELTQALPLLRQIDLNDVVVTGDALFAQRAVCTHIVEQGGQYMFEVDHSPTHSAHPLPRWLYRIRLPHSTGRAKPNRSGRIPAAC